MISRGDPGDYQAAPALFLIAGLYILIYNEIVALCGLHWIKLMAQNLSVYIAYARRDGAELAQRVNSGLESEGFQPWLDRERLDPGVEWQQTIQDAIRDSLAVVFIITPGSLKSEFILKVYLEAFERYNKQVFPILGGDVVDSDVPPIIRKRQWLDFRQEFDKPFSQLVAALQKIEPDGIVNTPIPPFDQVVGVETAHAEAKGYDVTARQTEPGVKENQTIDAPFIESASEVYEPTVSTSETHPESQTVQGKSGTVETTGANGIPESTQQETITGTGSGTLNIGVKATGTVSPSPLQRLDPRTLIHVLTDAPTTADVLGFRDYAIVLAEFIRSQQHRKDDHEQPKENGIAKPADGILPKPLVIAIDAPWGTGKTSLMYMLQEELKSGEGGFIPVWFNAWKYDQEESLWAALALKILRDVPQHGGFWSRVRLWWSSVDVPKATRTIIRWVVYAVMVGVLGFLALWFASSWAFSSLQPGDKDILPMLGLLEVLAQVFVPVYGGSAISILGVFAMIAVGVQVYRRFFKFDLNIAQYIKQPNYGERVGFLGEFDDDFRRIVRAVTQKGKNPLVIFIDDLDRCEPPRSVEIIEAINVLIDSQYCVYIIGMDSRGVAASIENKYAELKDFYESESDPGGLTLGQQFLEKIIQINFRIPPVTEETIAGFIDQNLRSINPPLLAQEQDNLQRSLERSVAGLGYNPRRVKRLMTELLNRPRKLLSSSGAVPGSESGVPEQTEPGQAVKTVALSDSAPDAELEQRRQRAREFQDMSFEDLEAVQQATFHAASVLDYNPRKIKRFLNEFRLRAAIADQRNLLTLGEIDLSRLGNWITIGTRWPDIIGILTEHPTFAAELLDAHTLREEWRALRAQPTPDDSAIKQKNAELGRALTQADIKRFIDAADLINLLGEMGDAARDTAQIVMYLHLPYTIPTGDSNVADSAPG
ncbi:MAG: TIR domain-containing protein [Anaerolineaceae bacterium]|nr:TIR domain-containing protein [Anaerolineaceae bacterium]